MSAVVKAITGGGGDGGAGAAIAKQSDQVEKQQTALDRIKLSCSNYVWRKSPTARWSSRLVIVRAS